MSDTMLQQINEAIFKRLHHLASSDGSVIKNLHKKYDDIEVTSQSQCTQLCFEYAGNLYTLNMNKLDDEELHNVETITNDLLIRYDFLRKVEAINYPENVNNRSRYLELLVSSIDYYKSAYVFLLDLTKTAKEDASDQ